MSKSKIAIAFKTVDELWSYARKIKAIDIEINTTDKILICDCSKEDLLLLAEYNGIVLEEYKSHRSPN
jgi:hypothetical protein